MNTYDNGKIYEFEEKPQNPKSNLASMGIYIFNWSKLREALINDNQIHSDSDFGKHIIPYMLENNESLYAYEFDSYWKDVGTIEAYWSANMELIKTLPSFNLYEDFWKIFTRTDHQTPQYISDTADLNTCIVSEGCEVYGRVYNSVLGYNVVIEEGVFLKNSIVMKNTVVKKNCSIERAIIDENCIIGENTRIGYGEDIINKSEPKIYNSGITVIGEDSLVPDRINIGKNCVISGKTELKDYIDNKLDSGETLIVTEEKI